MLVSSVVKKETIKTAIKLKLNNNTKKSKEITIKFKFLNSITTEKYNELIDYIYDELEEYKNHILVGTEINKEKNKLKIYFFTK